VVTRTAQQIGGSFGTAVLAVILSSAVTAHRGNLVTGFDEAFWWATAFSAVAVLLSRWLPAAPRTPAAAPGTTLAAAPGTPAAASRTPVAAPAAPLAAPGATLAAPATEQPPARLPRENDPARVTPPHPARREG
jgi:hypothetical protein